MDVTRFNSIKDVKETDVFKRSKDGKTIITFDGTRVTDALIAEAKTAKTRSAAATPGGGLNAEEVRLIVRSEMENVVRSAVPSIEDVRGVAADEAIKRAGLRLDDPGLISMVKDLARAVAREEVELLRAAMAADAKPKK